MRVRGLGRVKILGQRIHNRLSPGTLILLYHRIAQLSSDPQRLCVSPEHFSEQLQVIGKKASAVSLLTLRQFLDARKVPKKSIVVTFDDGAADNLLAAKPVLERYDIPATIFVSTGYMKTGREYWWDELERIILHPGKLPSQLTLMVNGKTLQWRLDGAAHYPQAEYDKHRVWHASMPYAPTQRQRLYRSLIELLLPLEAQERCKLLDELKNWARDEILARSSHRALTSEEVKKLADDGLEIGAHTVSHSMLAALSRMAQQTEILQSKKDLEEVLGYSVKSFAYPFGTLSDYTAESVAIVRESGFECACSNFKGVVQPGTDIFQLPRMIVRDWSGDEFAARLENWFRG